ncbi:uncharacterized protein LOC124613933 [Schistocerca americana]|uniref:uncharacterized protein LOC124613933 n=1 Tax=Schistocerca americana TaxID=7009 RepID=UPI001F4F1EB3|nr:uncharacterized protein LOC124613933 [Schistocerca americana]
MPWTQRPWLTPRLPSMTSRCQRLSSGARLPPRPHHTATTPGMPYGALVACSCHLDASTTDPRGAGCSNDARSELCHHTCRRRHHIHTDALEAPHADVLPEVPSESEPDRFWHKVGQISSNDGAHFYCASTDFTLAILLPLHSTAECERVFSKIFRMKMKLTNQLSTSAVNVTLLASECAKWCCATFQLIMSMIERMAEGHNEVDRFPTILDDYIEVSNSD